MPMIDARLREMLADLVGADVPAEGDIVFGSLPGWDSITHFHLLLDVEQTFGVEIPDAVGIDLDSLARLRAWVAEHGGEAVAEA